MGPTSPLSPSMGPMSPLRPITFTSETPLSWTCYPRDVQVLGTRGFWGHVGYGDTVLGTWRWVNGIGGFKDLEVAYEDVGVLGTWQ